MRKSLIKLAKRIESGWQMVGFDASPVNVAAGWYVCEFILKGALANTPRIVIEDADGKPKERLLTGFHSGRNRMLFFLPAGRMTAISESIEFTLLAKVPWWKEDVHDRGCCHGTDVAAITTHSWQHGRKRRGGVPARDRQGTDQGRAIVNVGATVVTATKERVITVVTRSVDGMEQTPHMTKRG
jgi:hypothetical protein